MNLDNYTGAQLAASPRLARAWSRAWKAEAKRLGLPVAWKSKISNPKSKILR